MRKMRTVNGMLPTILGAIVGFSLINAFSFDWNVYFAIVGPGGVIIGLFVGLCSVGAERTFAPRIGVVGNVLLNMAASFVATIGVMWWVGEIPAEYQMINAATFAVLGGFCGFLYRYFAGPRVVFKG